ncbi:hypothetical protein E2C01_061192 [Portunus trituberculatus]|uniref:Uncharacterized protein n=1 Tax=Portunus trituberculatus TaxID=210409 RepID=A0A5B7H7G7_PORTR|nr:hypothetical protein [Portunus trituberculatus]
MNPIKEGATKPRPKHNLRPDRRLIAFPGGLVASHTTLAKPYIGDSGALSFLHYCWSGTYRSFVPQSSSL